MDWSVGDLGYTCMMYLFNHREISTSIDEILWANIQHLKRAYKDQINDFVKMGYNDLIEPFTKRVGKYIDGLEEKILLSESAGDSLAKNFFVIAEKYFYGYDGYEKNTFKALRYYRESAKRGFYRAYIYVGLYWLIEKKSLEQADSAWREFYNAIYNKVCNNKELLTEYDKNIILEGFYDMFYLANIYDAVQSPSKSICI